MNSGGGSGEVEQSDAFAAIANETRMAILVALAERRPETWPDGLRYNDLMAHVDVDDSGKFNYHLQQLRPEFVAKRDDTYQLTLPGLRVYQMLIAGYVNAEAGPRRVDPGADCPRCGDALDARVTEWSTLLVSCSGCGMETVPAELLHRCVESHGPRRALRAADLARRHRMGLFARGVCPFCLGSASTTIHTDASDLFSVVTDDLDVLYVFECGECGWFDASTAGGVLYSHSVVASLFADRGEDVYDYRTWELSWVCTDDHTTVVDRDPWRIRVDVAVEPDGRAVTVDGDAAVVDVASREF